jgi:phenylalanyl-tRNA synthetase beta chain
MRFNYRWLLNYIALDQPIESVLEALTMSGLEVEGAVDVGLPSRRIVIGEVVDVQPHGRARKLTVCRVRASADPSAEPVRVVCGAPNVRVGMKAPLALPGAVLPNGMKIEAATIRDEGSEGMLCSGIELGWNDDANGIMALDESLPVGEPLDCLIEVGITPNRPDCLSVVGVARDLAAWFRKPWHLPKIRCTEVSELINSAARVTTEDKEGCPRYTARVVRNVQIGPSPTWLARAVEAAGLRSINNVVDVTNYVLLELGHPLHAFDLEKIVNHEIIVRRARPNETIRTLDGQLRNLTPDDLLITDPTRPIALAGVMGGENTEITETTGNVLLESAYFDPIRIRRTRRRLEIQTDSSFRFERGTDRENVHVALNRAAQLIREVAGGEILKGMIDVQGPRPKSQPLTLRVSRANAILGTDLAGSEMGDILASLGCELVSGSPQQLLVNPPSYRVDIFREIDLIEEIGRMHGYSKILQTVPFIPARPATKEPLRDLRAKIVEMLVNEGLTEIVTYSFTDRESLALSLAPTDGAPELLNPLAQTQSLMRTALLPSMLETIAHNQKRGTPDLALCEAAKSYHRDGDSNEPYTEHDEAVAALVGMRPGGWSEPPRAWDFFDMKGIVERIFEQIGVEPDALERAQAPQYHPGQSAVYRKNGRALCAFGQLNPRIATGWDLRGDVIVAEFDLEAIAPCMRPARRFKPLPQYPAVVRDVAFVVNSDEPAGAIEATLRDAAGQWLESLRLFDVYEGEHIPAGKRGLAYSLTFRAADRTLTDEEVNLIRDHIVAAAADRHGAILRT